MIFCVTLLAATLSLNGSWDFRFEEGKSYEAGDPSFVATETMPVPACYDMMPKYLTKRGTGLYRRSFTLERPVENAWIVVEGMGLTGRFAVDGRELGVYPYPYAELEIPTGPLAAGEHVIFAAIDNRFDRRYQKLANPFYDFYQFGGFYHGVSLVFDNRKLRVRTRDYKTGTVEIEAVNFKESAFDATLVFDGRNEVKATFANGRTTVKVPLFKLWSPESPNLHTVTLLSSTSTSDLDCAPQARFGIRTIEAKNRRLYLNGKELYLKGANRHESHPTFGAATPESLMMADIQNLKALGGNYFRGAHYQQARRFLDLCDENGVLVWEESLGWGNQPRDLGDEGFVRDQLLQTTEMVRTSFNHPSVVFYAFMNEFAQQTKEGRALAEKLVKAIRAEDSGRLVTFACNHVLDEICCDLVDVVSVNLYPGWIDLTEAGEPAHLRDLVFNGKFGVKTTARRFREKYPDKPLTVSEMGTCGVYGRHDPAAAQWTEEFQAEYVGDVVDAVFAEPELCGIAIWQFTDARSYHRDGATLRVKPFAENLAGLYDGYRRPKLSARVVSEKFRGLKK